MTHAAPDHEDVLDDDDEVLSLFESTDPDDIESVCLECGHDNDGYALRDLAETSLPTRATISNGECSLLLKLPAELRMRIFSAFFDWDIIHITQSSNDDHKVKAAHCVDSHIEPTWIEHVRNHPGTGWGDNLDRRHEDCDGKVDLALLHTCRQVYLEAAALPFQIPVFIISSAQAFHCFITSLTNVQVLSIKKIMLSTGRLHKLKSCDVKRLGVLESLHINLEISFPGRPEWLLKSYEARLATGEDYIDFDHDYGWMTFIARKVSSVISVATDFKAYCMVTYTPSVTAGISRRLEDKIRVQRNTLDRYLRA